MASTMDLTTAILFKISGTATKTADLGGTPTSKPLITESCTLADGTGAEQADLVYFDSGPIGASGVVSIDLAGTLKDVYGDTVTFDLVKAVMVKNTSTTAAVINVGGGTGMDGTNAWDTWATSCGGSGSERVIVRAGGAMAIFAPDATGYGVTAGSVDILMLSETAALAGTYEIIVVGVST